MVSDPGVLGGVGYPRGAVTQSQKLKKEAGIIGLLYAGVGGMIGSGWLFGPLSAAQQAGPLSILAWLIGGVAVLALALVYAELATILPRSGALVHMSHLTHGRLVGRIWGWILVLAYVTIAPVEAVAILSYSDAYIPGLIDHATTSLTPKGIMAAIALLAVMVSLNFFTIRHVLTMNSTATWWKLAVPIGTIFVLLSASYHPENFTIVHEKADVEGLFTAVSTAGIFFSLFGFRQAIDLAGETKNPGRALPIAVIGTVLIGVLLYAALQFAFIAALDPAMLKEGGWPGLRFDHISGPFAALAVAVGAGWWAMILYSDAIVSPAACGFIYTTTASRILMASGETGDLPRWLRLVNRFGVPWLALLVTFGLGALFFFPFPSWHKLVSYISSITVLSYGIGPILLLRLRLSMPEIPRSFKLRGAWLIAPFAFITSNFIILWAGFETVNFLFLLLGAFSLVYAAYYCLTPQSRKEDLDWLHALWLIPYFGGMWLISALGPAELGGNGLYSFTSAMLLVALLSIVTLMLALATTLPETRLREEMAVVANPTVLTGAASARDRSGHLA
ncbi:APC family permease [Rhodoligotrophos defluvii]|uniref:APC family permease n=1 Tax=Rhodoligotrophos defluvii TaxID=2561934 RepID=UPI0014855082|nr:APC family permease [Rhodoligotrophos defluvii]